MGCDVAELFSLVGRHRRFDERLLRKVLSQDEALVRNYATPESKKLYRMQRSVMGCLHLKKGFMRFRLSEHGILYARTRLEHDVIDLLLRHFHGRYPGFIVAVEVAGVTHAVNPDGSVWSRKRRVEDVVEVLEAEHPRDPGLTGLSYENLWGAFYGSQYIRERRNLKLMRKMMPGKHRDRGSIEEFRSSESARLTDFQQP